jgi:hypothetical protein
MRIIATVLALACGSIASAQERPGQFAHGAVIAADGADSHYRFALPAAAYMGIARRDLADLRIFNGSGETVPYAFVPLRPKSLAPEVRAAKLFPLYGEEAKGLNGVDVRIEHTPGGTVVRARSGGPSRPRGRKLLGYLIDAGEEKPPLEALNLDWEARQGFTGFARVEASEDLKHWTSLVQGAPVLFLEHHGARLEQKRIELAGARARYLRLSFDGVAADFALKQASIELRADKSQPERDWFSAVAAQDSRRRGEYFFDTGGHFPVDRLRVALPEPNTVAQAQIFVRDRPEDPWLAVTSTTLYRLRRESRDIVNPDVVVSPNASRYWLLRVEQRGGGLGAGEVRLEFGWVPHELVFAARGASPFSLAYGMKSAKPGAMPLATVVPGYKTDEPIPAKAAAVSVQPPLKREPVSPLKDPGSFMKAAVDSGEAKKWALWAALLAGVLVLAWMAFGLLRQVGKPAGDRESP